MSLTFASIACNLPRVSTNVVTGVGILDGQPTVTCRIDSKICKDRASGINYADANWKAASASMLIEEVESICGVEA